MRMRNITKTFYAVTALKDVNFDLHKGEVHALVGENGAGKSTLMKILSGSYPDNTYEGEIEINGEKVSFPSTRDAEQAGIEMIYQEISLTPELSVAGNVFLGYLPRKKIKAFVDWKRAESLCEEALKTVGLDVHAGDVVRTLSTSQQQLLSIAKALYRHPEILALDEPTRGIDVGAKGGSYNIMTELARNGVAVIMISSELPELLAMCDRFVILFDGKISGQFMREEVSEELFMHAATGMLKCG